MIAHVPSPVIVGPNMHDEPTMPWRSCRAYGNCQLPDHYPQEPCKLHAHSLPVQVPVLARGMSTGQDLRMTQGLRKQ